MGSERHRLTDEQYAVVKENMNRIINLARDMLEQIGEVAPLFLVMEKDGVRGMDITPYFEDKALVESIMKSIQMAPDTVATIFASEAWMAKVDVESELGKKITAGEDIDISPSEDPNKMEVVVVLCESRAGTVSAYAEIDRSGEKPTLGKPTFMPHDEETKLRGRFTGGFAT